MAPSSDQYLEWATVQIEALHWRLHATYEAIDCARGRLTRGDTWAVQEAVIGAYEVRPER